MLFEELYRIHGKEFAQKAKAVIAELEVWNEHELFYRHWYELRHDKEKLQAFFNSVDTRLFSEEIPWEEAPFTPEYLEQNRNGIHLSEDHFWTNANSRNLNVLFFKHPRYLPEFNHKHEFFEITFVLQGQCTDIIAGKRMVLPAGSLYFITPETYHATGVFDDSLIVYLMIKRSTFDEVFVNLLTASDGVLSDFFLRNIYNKDPGYLVFNIAKDKDLLQQFLIMLIEQSVGDENSGRIMESQLLIFFFMLMRKYGKRPLVYEQAGLKGRHWDIIAYINKHFRTLTHAKLAAKFNLSIAYCSRVIKSITGKTFTALVQDLRMNQARTMLRQSAAKIYDISFSLGYENQEVFIRNFKKVHGITPTQYRKENSDA